MLAEAPDGPLRGVPVGIKDEWSVPWRAPQNGAARPAIPAGESDVYRRMRDAGAVIAGVTHMHFWGAGTTGHISAYGPVGNPWDPKRCAGGSSGGSASAVGARMVGAAVGADGGGSVRLPAAYCGVTGLKLTNNAVPRGGHVHRHSALGATGPLCRDAADARLFGSVLLDRELPAGDGSGLRARRRTRPVLERHRPRRGHRLPRGARGLRLAGRRDRARRRAVRADRDGPDHHCRGASRAQRGGPRWSGSVDARADQVRAFPPGRGVPPRRADPSPAAPLPRTSVRELRPPRLADGAGGSSDHRGAVRDAPLRPLPTRPGRTSARPA